MADAPMLVLGVIVAPRMACMSMRVKTFVPTRLSWGLMARCSRAMATGNLSYRNGLSLTRLVRA